MPNKTYTPSQLADEVQILAENYRGAANEIEENNELFDDIENAVAEKDGESKPLRNEIINRIQALKTLGLKIVQEKPTSNIEENIIYLIPKANQDENDIYDEYIYINDSWELIGNTTADLSGYAPLNSPQLSGVPSAPTAAYGTNTDQIATTAFVQRSLRPTVIVSVNDIPVGTTVSVTLTLMIRLILLVLQVFYLTGQENTAFSLVIHRLKVMILLMFLFLECIHIVLTGLNLLLLIPF